MSVNIEASHNHLQRSWLSSTYRYMRMLSSDGVFIGSASLFVGFLGGSLTFPFLQSQRDKLGCDALCYGSMQSARSGLSMFGTILVGRLSDRYGRHLALYIGTTASLLSYLVNYNFTNLTAIWLSMIPSALLNQNFGVMKAHFADISEQFGYSESDRASAIGRLGMAAGFSFMLGPVLATSLFSTFEQATFAAILLTLLSAFILTFMPVSSTEALKKNDVVSASPAAAATTLTKPSLYNSVIGLFYMPAVQTPGVQLLLLMRCCMALAFHIFMIIWTVSLKTRFAFAAKDHAMFMGWIGLCYSISQGFLAKLFIQWTGEDPTWLLQMCIVALSLGRVAAMLTASLPLVYIIMAAVIVALGIINTAMSAACARLAGKDQVGGLYGVFESVENLAGFVGPALGGLLQRAHPVLPLTSVVVVYGIVLVAVTLYYRKHVVQFAHDHYHHRKANEDEAVEVEVETEPVTDATSTPQSEAIPPDEEVEEVEHVNKQDKKER